MLQRAQHRVVSQGEGDGAFSALLLKAPGLGRTRTGLQQGKSLSLCSDGGCKQTYGKARVLIKQMFATV